MTQPLDDAGRPVRIGRAVLRTPGLAGQVEVAGPETPAGMRASNDFTTALLAAVDETEVRPLETYRITGGREVAAPAVGARSTPAGEPAIELELPAPASGWVQVVLASDEAGVATWHLAGAEEPGGAEAGRGAGSWQRFLVRRHVPPRPEGAGTRGVAGAVGRKLLQVLAFRVLESAGGGVGRFVAGRWEAARRPYRFRTFTPGTYRQADGAPVAVDRWADYQRGRALLLLHGTFSRAHSAFGGLPPEVVAELHRHYDGRLLAFDHFTVSHSPEENVRQLLMRIPSGVRLDVDLLTHSRGGLVGRLLRERPQPVTVHRSVFVAPPNAGTVLADGRHLSTFVDRFTTLLNLFPDNGVADALAVVIDVVKHLAVGALDQLAGLSAMRPGGDWLGRLNRDLATVAPVPSYFAVGADYEPAELGLRAFLYDGVMDRVFGGEHNDLVVPTAGVYDLGEPGRLPTLDRMDLPASRGVPHSGYFADPSVARQIVTWLSD